MYPRKYPTREEAREAALRKSREWHLAHVDYVREYANQKYRNNDEFREKTKRDNLARYHRKKAERAAIQATN